MEVSINRYFLNHPDMVLGVWTAKDTLYGEGYGVASNGELAVQLKGAIGRLPEAVPATAGLRRESPAAPAFTAPPAIKHVTEGSFFIGDDRTICQSLDGRTAARRLWRRDAHRLRLTHRQTLGRPGGTARPRPPRPAIAERGLAREAPRRRPPRT